MISNNVIHQQMNIGSQDSYTREPGELSRTRELFEDQTEDHYSVSSQESSHSQDSTSSRQDSSTKPTPEPQAGSQGSPVNPLTQSRPIFNLAEVTGRHLWATGFCEVERELDNIYTDYSATIENFRIERTQGSVPKPLYEGLPKWSGNWNDGTFRWHWG